MNLEELVAAIVRLSGPELTRVRTALEQRAQQLIKPSTVFERRNHEHGMLQLEYRQYPKTGTRRGPYWYFYWREESHQHSLYLGKTDHPETVLDEKFTYVE